MYVCTFYIVDMLLACYKCMVIISGLSLYVCAPIFVVCVYVNYVCKCMYVHLKCSHSHTILVMIIATIINAFNFSLQ